MSKELRSFGFCLLLTVVLLGGMMLLSDSDADASSNMMIERKTTFHSAASATATGNVMNLTGIANVAIQVSGTYTTASLAFEGSIDGTNWVEIQAMDMNDGSVATTATANGLYVAPVSGLMLFRSNLTWTSGTSITATGIGTDLPFERVSIS